MNRYIYKLFVAGLLSSALTGCSGPAPVSQPQAKPAQSDEAQPVRQEQRPKAATPAAEERSDVSMAPRPKPVNKELPRQPAPARQANSANAAPVAKPAAPSVPAAPPAPAAAASNSPAPGTLTLPAPVAPAIDLPAPPAQEEVKPAPEPPRHVRIPSGTLVSVRMIDSVDSSTAHARRNFKASLDQPIVLDKETIFPRGSEVYVKLARVETAGRVRGQSELELQLDRIFLARQSYLLDTSTYTTTGTSQSTKTARSRWFRCSARSRDRCNLGRRQRRCDRRSHWRRCRSRG